ncbi:hypothetical protein [Microbacterium sp. H1-D42]|uniref:glycoside hydrolase family 38 N-terminal domain-containing protein n=1 Tax=Microbacterium sp. H1-D42 TaxID=2925844 RepID=UPI001F5374FA|nr:hypothetical protein [Microbacterium sp. H1-D42]UNK70497.1 hypothetical protein MNR00_15260 [Microbacterium sp. H1-D42]
MAVELNASLATGARHEERPHTGQRRTHPFDHDRAIKGLRDGAYQTVDVEGGTFDVVLEPLIRNGADGRERPIRIRTALALTRALVSIDGATELSILAEPTSDGCRFFIPHVDSAALAVTLPEISESSFALQAEPIRDWTVSLVHHSHFDIGYTDMQGRVIREQLAYLDDALRLSEAAGDDDDDSSFRWSVESIWVLREWIERRSAQTVERFFDQVRAGRIELAALPFNVHTELCSTEELHGLLRYSRDISARFGVEIPVAYQTDIPGCVAGTVDALAQNGVKYLSVAHNWAGRSVPYLRDGLNLPRFFRWESPAGNSVLVWITTSAEGIAYQEAAVLGFNNHIDEVEDLLPLYLHAEATSGFPYDENVFGFALGDRAGERTPYPWDEIHLRVMGRVADNAPPARRLNEIVEAWNQRWESPRLKVTRTQDFFEIMEDRFGDQVETVSGDWNNWWADGNGSGSRHVQLTREAQSTISQATSIAALLDDTVSAGFDENVDDAWENVELFDEHTWGASNPWTSADDFQESGTDQWHWKAEKALRAQQEGSLLLQEALHAYAEAHGGGDGAATIWVANTEGRVRSGMVTLLLPESVMHTTSVITISDAVTGESVPFAEHNQVNPNHREAGRFVRFFASDVPALGGRRFDVNVLEEGGRIVAADGTMPVQAPAEPTWVLDNGITRVELDPRTGVVRSLTVRGRELVGGTSAFGFNTYVHDTLATQGEHNHLTGFLYDSGPDLVLLAERTSTTHVAFLNAGSDAVSSWIRVRSYAPGVSWIDTTFRLDAGAEHLDIENRVNKPYRVGKESGFFAFPFAMTAPAVRYEIGGAVAGSGIDAVPGAADYMHTVRDWVALIEDGAAFALIAQDAPLVQIGDIALPFSPFPGTLAEREEGTVFSWIHNNLWDTNFPAGQAFEMFFAYRVGVVSAADADAVGVRAAQLAGDLIRPLRGVATSDIGSAAAEVTGIEVDDDRVRVLSARSLADGQVRIALQSLATSPVETAVTVHAGISAAELTSLVGRGGQPLDVQDGSSVQVTLPPFGTAAVAVRKS